MTATPVNGEVWWCEPPEIGRRPVVVLSRTPAIAALGRAMVAPCTTTVRGLPSEVPLEPDRDPIPKPSVVNLDSVDNVGIGVLVERIGRLSSERMGQVCRALTVATSCPEGSLTPGAHQRADQPPSIVSDAPVMNPARGEHR